MRRVNAALVFVGAVTLLVPAIASAQAAISGVVRDTSGAVLPGVSVEASSPALIEKTRTVVTDGAGLYSIVDLPPGAYTVTFSLQGFSVVKREGIELIGSFTADVNAEMKVGTLEETVVVTGASPVVDVKDTLAQEVLTHQEIDAVPGSRTTKGRADLIPGVVVPSANTGVVAHGSDSSDSHYFLDGFNTGMIVTGRGTAQLGVGSVTQTQELSFQELVYDIGAQPAEYAMSGVRMNLIPKEGGNRFTVEGIAYGSRQAFESNNLTPTLMAQGLQFAPQIFTYDYNPVVGGPLLKDKLWYFLSTSGNDSDSYVLDTYFNPNEPSTPANCRTPTSHCLADTGAHLNTSETVRLTDQLTQNNKLRFSFDNTKLVSPFANFGNGIQPEAAWLLNLTPTYVAQMKWTSTVTNRLLIEAGYSYDRGDFFIDYQPANSPTAIALYDLATGVTSQNNPTRYAYTHHLQQGKASVSYVTGSHSIKVGIDDRWGWAKQSNPYNGDMEIRYEDAGVPVSVRVVNGTALQTQNINFNGGVYAQDQWKLKRLTINFGARWDRFNTSVPAEQAPAGYFTPAVAVPAINNVPNWNNFSPRLGGAWDVTGDGKTAVKASMGRYMAGHALDIASLTNPIYSVTDTRAWTDPGCIGPSCVTINANGTPIYSEIGPSSNPLFGTVAGTTTLDPNLVRDKNWSYETTIERELFPRISVGASYYHRRYYDLPWTNNTAITNADYTPFTITTPPDPRLPGGGGQQITMYNLMPQYFGHVRNVEETSTNYRIYNGFELTAHLPLLKKGFLVTSLTEGKTEVNQCEGGAAAAGPDPNLLRFCDTTSGFRPIYKLIGGLPLPWDMMVSAHYTIYDTPGSGLGLIPPYEAANYAVTSANSGGVKITNSSITVNLVPPFTLWENLYRTLDGRLSKTFTMGRGKVTALVEGSNLLQSTSVLLVNQTYGPLWLRPQSIEPGRYVKFGTQIRF